MKMSAIGMDGIHGRRSGDHVSFQQADEGTSVLGGVVTGIGESVLRWCEVKGAAAMLDRLRPAR